MLDCARPAEDGWDFSAARVRGLDPRDLSGTGDGLSEACRANDGNARNETINHARQFIGLLPRGGLRAAARSSFTGPITESTPGVERTRDLGFGAGDKVFHPAGWTLRPG